MHYLRLLVMLGVGSCWLTAAALPVFDRAPQPVMSEAEILQQQQALAGELYGVEIVTPYLDHLLRSLAAADLDYSGRAYVRDFSAKERCVSHTLLDVSDITHRVVLLMSLSLSESHTDELQRLMPTYWAQLHSVTQQGREVRYQQVGIDGQGRIQLRDQAQAAQVAGYLKLLQNACATP